ncbi:MAG TPA: hypothetical protein VHM25_03890 [Polyangiaceae bacterium]|nr:hypothetical protein [Polyangiaceae bacterium]
MRTRVAQQRALPLGTITEHTPSDGHRSLKLEFEFELEFVTIEHYPVARVPNPRRAH